MTIDGAISDLNNLLKADDIPIYYKPSIKKVIETIEQEPCEDAVSREAVMKILYAIKNNPCNYPEDEAIYSVEHLPPVTPKQRTGHWRHYEGMLICSECGTEFYDDIMEYCGDDVPKWCPDCGCRMFEPKMEGVRE